MTHVAHNTVRKAFWNWFTVGEATYGQAVPSFYRVTGIKSFLDARYDVTPEQARRLELMAGPHGKTMVKMFLAQGDETHGTSKAEEGTS